MYNTRNTFGPGPRVCERSACGCGKMSQAFPDNYGYAMGYIAYQCDNTVYDACRALCNGTIFPALDMPFMRSGCCK